MPCGTPWQKVELYWRFCRHRDPHRQCQSSWGRHEHGTSRFMGWLPILLFLACPHRWLVSISTQPAESRMSSERSEKVANNSPTKIVLTWPKSMLTWRSLFISSLATKGTLLRTTIVVERRLCQESISFLNS